MILVASECWNFGYGQIPDYFPFNFNDDGQFSATVSPLNVSGPIWADAATAADGAY